MLQNATSLRKSAPWPPNISDEHVSCTAPATENASLQILFKCPTPAIVFGNATKPSRFAHFWHGAQSPVPARRNDIWTSKSGPSMWCVLHFDLGMCFSPQGRALFRHLNFQKCSEHGVPCTFWLRNVLRATTACTLRHLNFQKWSALVCFVHFDLEMSFAPLIWPHGSSTLRSHKSLEKHSVSRLSYLFAHLDLLSSHSFSFWSSFFFSSLLWLFPSLLFICPYCRKFDF